MGRVILGVIIACLAPAGVSANEQLSASLPSGTISEFHQTRPKSNEAPPMATVVEWSQDANGLNVVFSNHQDASRFPPRIQRQARDRVAGVDRVTLAINVGQAGSGYAFTVSRSGSVSDRTISNGNKFDSDWDGVWTSSVRETELGWEASLYIPWSSLSTSDASRRASASIYAERVVAATDLRAAYPNIVASDTNFADSFASIKLMPYKTSLLRFSPYASVLHDRRNSDTTTRFGIDVEWRPSSQFQLLASLNPDFGQVEADDLVINFSSIETSFSDKRPFFTSNQNLFDHRSPTGDQLLYTRRLGGARDDGDGLSDIDLGLKAVASHGRIDIAGMAVRESDPGSVGKSAVATSANMRTAFGGVGLVATYIERPYLDREALVFGTTGNWIPSDRFTAKWALMRSKVDRPAGTVEGNGGWITLFYQPTSEHRAQLDFTRYGRTFSFNDMGFQQRRNLQLLHASYEFLPSSRKEGWRSDSLSANFNFIRNSAGRYLGADLTLAQELVSESGASADFTLAGYRSGPDDLISRGNGPVLLSGGYIATAGYASRRFGHARYEVDASLASSGYARRQWSVSPSVAFFFNEELSASFGAKYESFRDRLLWSRGALFDRYGSSEQLLLASTLDWLVGSRHEFRAKAQWITANGESPRRYRLVSERLQPTSSPALQHGFSTAAFGLQLRYRYRFGLNNDFFLTYGRGAEIEYDLHRGVDQLIQDISPLADTEQFVAKVVCSF